MTLFYIAYGSNMSPKRLQSRIPSAEPLTTVRLEGHKLCFHKRSRVDGSAKCDAWYSGNPEHAVYGLLYRMPAAEKALLDRYEGLGQGYEIKTISISIHGNRHIEAFYYYATDIQQGLLPYEWYKQHVLHGARYAGLPEEYLATITTVETCRDPDTSRHHKEMAIYDK